MNKKNQRIAIGMLSLALLGVLFLPYIKRENEGPALAQAKGKKSLSGILSSNSPASDKVPSQVRTASTLSPLFNKYAEETNFAERTESLRGNIVASLEQIATEMKVEDEAKEKILAHVAEAFEEEKIREELANILAEQLTEADIETLGELTKNPVSKKVQGREDELLQQKAVGMAKFLEQFQDPEAFKLAQADAEKIIEELHLLQDTEKMFHTITKQIFLSLNQTKQTVGPEIFQEATKAILNGQRQALTLSAMYLYQDLNDKELGMFKEIYTNTAAVKERQIVFGYFEKIFAHLGTSVGRLVAQEQASK